MSAKKPKSPLPREQVIEHAFEKNRIDLDETPDCTPHRVIVEGDELEVGNLQNCVAAAVSPDNRFICVEADDSGVQYGVPFDNGRKIFGVWPWFVVYRKSGIEDTSLFEISGGGLALERGHRSISDIEGLLQGAIRRGFHTDKTYQREYVWTDKDRSRLLDSAFRGLSIGSFIFISNRKKNDFAYEVLDGQQRLTTLIDFFFGKFTYRGKYWHQLSAKDRNQFNNVRVSWIEMEGSTLSQRMKAEIFLIVNDSGVPQTAEHLQKVLEFLKRDVSGAQFQDCAKNNVPENAAPHGPRLATATSKP